MRLPLAAAFALLAAAAPLGAQSATRDWHPADRTVIGDFARITAVAAASDRVYAASPTALLVWNTQFRRWEGPFQPPPGADFARVFAALVDPLDNSVWLGRSDGWVHYQPDIDLWEFGSVPGRVLDIAADLDAPLGGIFLRTASGWLNVARGSGAAVPGPAPRRPVRPTSVGEVLRENPSLQANRAAILMDERLRNVAFTSAARSFDRQGWYLGTSGAGLLYLPDGAALPERLPFGMAGDRISAVFAVPGGVWAANDRTPTAEAALTFVASDLTAFRYVHGGAALGLPFEQARELTGLGPALWVASDQGAVRVDPANERAETVGEARGLPDGRVLSLVAWRGAITAGTAHGLVRIGDSLGVEVLAPDFHDAALAVALGRDSTWVGTQRGLFVLPPGGRELVMPGPLTTSPALQAPVVGLEWMADTLVALTRDRLLWREPRSGRWTLGPVLSAQLGRLRMLVADRAGFWIGGDRGVGYAGLATPALRVLPVGDIPGDVLDLAVDAEHLWVGTSRGLARFRLDAVRP